MFAKLLLVLTVTACTALALLSLRQSRIETVHDMTRIHQNTMVQRRMIWNVRRRLAGMLQADRLQALVESEREWTTLERPRTILTTTHTSDALE